jgi:2-polyprenyl-6-hydroxyphenyl methylase/3-demethylubiquinone-9 3-methyltransferase
MRPAPTPEELCHERLALRQAFRPSEYDTRRRVEVLTQEFLSDERVRGRSALDVGCGLGDFSESLARRGAVVVACDIGPTLVEHTRRRVGCRAEVADALALEEHFGSERFDLVVSSECIEHTPAPGDAVRQMVRVLKPGGVIALSTPNRLWHPAVRFATIARLRPYEGHENFGSWRGLRALLDESGVRVEREKGLHLLPFQLGLHPLSRWCEEHLQGLRGLMINICVLGRKALAGEGGDGG